MDESKKGITMRYNNCIEGRFLDRPNRFVAHVEIGGSVEEVHVKNTGRCRELLKHGSQVFLTAPGSEGRKTKYDLICVRKSTGLLVNIDSQAPNAVTLEWLKRQSFDRIFPEYTYGQSRIDFCMERRGQRYLLEAKGCTLEVDGIGYFPDAPTERGIRHLGELAHAAREGIVSALAFVIQMDGIREVRPNIATHPEFGEALKNAREAGVHVLFLPCHVDPDQLTIQSSISI